MPSFGKTLAGLEAMSTSLSKVAEQAKSVAPLLDTARKKVEESRKSFDELDRLLEQSKQKQNDFSLELELSIEAVRLGAMDIREFIAKWGDAVIATADGMRTIRETFSGADLEKYRQQIQELIQDVTSGAASLDTVLAFLKENAGSLAKGLINILELFKQGKATLEDVQRVIEATKEAFPGREGDALAEAIRKALEGGQL